MNNIRSRTSVFSIFVFVMLALFNSACSATSVTPAVEQDVSAPIPSPVPSTTQLPDTPVPTTTLTPTIVPTNTVVPTPTNSPTPDPYSGLTIADLTMRDYGGGEIKIEQELGTFNGFKRTLISWPSDGLTIYGFMNVPLGEGPFPVVLVLHGYIDPVVYGTLTYTTRYADALASQGYLVVHPNYRNHAPSDSGPNEFRIGYAVDVLNLVGLIRQGVLELAAPDSIGVWGHSMGGGIALRTVTVSSDIRAAVLYGSMSGDESKNFDRIFNYWTDGQAGQWEFATSGEDLLRISPIYHLGRITAAVSVHHGASDTEVPPEWSDELCTQLEIAGKSYECFSYPGAAHTFGGEADALFQQRVLDFFEHYLRRD